MSAGVGADPIREDEGANGKGWIDGSHGSEHCTNILVGGWDVAQWAKDLETDPGWSWVAEESRGWFFEEQGEDWVPESGFRSASGVVGLSKVTHTDFPAAHDSHDVIVFLRVDEGDLELLSHANPPNNDIEHMDSIDELEDPEAIELEWELGTRPHQIDSDPEDFFPKQFWPSKGDRVWTNGHWVFDCGHGIEEDIGGESDPQHRRTEIHPPRAIATMRNQAQTLPGTGTTPVNVTRTDLYIHGHAGFVNEILYCGPSAIVDAQSPLALPECDDVWEYPHRGTPIDADFQFDLCLPVRPSEQAIPVVTVDDDISDRSTIGEDEIPVEIEARDASYRCEHSAPGISYDQETMLRVTVPLEGTSAEPSDVYAREITAGWISPPDPPLEKFMMKATDMWLWKDVQYQRPGGLDWDPFPSDNCKCTFFWANVNQAAGGEWLRLSTYATGDMDDFEANQVCEFESCYTQEQGHMGFEGAEFGPFYARPSVALRAQSGGWGQGCVDGHYGALEDWSFFEEEDPHRDPGAVFSCRGGLNEKLPVLDQALSERTPVPSTFELGGRDWGEGYHATSVAYGDVDGDGYDELGVTRKAGTNMRFQILEDGRGGNAYEILHSGGTNWPSTAYATSIDFGDVDGDGNEEFGVTLAHEPLNDEIGYIEQQPRYILYDDTWGGYEPIHPVDPFAGSPEDPEIGGRPWGAQIQATSIAFGDVDDDGLDEVGVTRNAKSNLRFTVLDDGSPGADFEPLLSDGGESWGDSWFATSIAFGDVDSDPADEIGVTRYATDSDGMRYRIYDDHNGDDPFAGIFSGGKGWGETWATSIAFGDVDFDPAEEFAVSLKSDTWGFLIRDDGDGDDEDDDNGNFKLLHRPEGTVAGGEDNPRWEDLDGISVAMGDLTGDGEDETVLLLRYPGGQRHCENTAFWPDEPCLALFVAGDEGTDFRVLAPGDLASFILGGDFFSPTYLGDWGLFEEPWHENSYPQMVALGDANQQDEEAVAMLCGLKSNCNEATGNYRIEQVPDDDEIDDLAAVPRPGDSKSESYAIRFSMDPIPLDDEDDVTVDHEKSCQRAKDKEADREDPSTQVFRCQINVTNPEGPGIPRGVTVVDQLDEIATLVQDPWPTFELLLDDGDPPSSVFEGDQVEAFTEETQDSFSCLDHGEIHDTWFQCDLHTISKGGKAEIVYFVRYQWEDVLDLGVQFSVYAAENSVTTNCPSCSPVTTTTGIPFSGGGGDGVTWSLPGYDAPFTPPSGSFEWGHTPRVDLSELFQSPGDQAGSGVPTDADSVSLAVHRLNGGPSVHPAQGIVAVDGGPTEIETQGSGRFVVVAQPLVDGNAAGSPVGTLVGVDDAPPAPFDVRIDDGSTLSTSGLPVVDGRSATVSWDRPTDSGAGVAAYRYQVDGQDPQQIADPGTGRVSGTLTGLTPGPHRLTVVAVDGVGNERASSIDFCVGTQPTVSCGKQTLVEEGVTFEEGSEEHRMLEEIPRLVERQLEADGEIACETMGTCDLPRAASVLDGTVHVVVEGEKGIYGYEAEMESGTLIGFDVHEDPSLSDSGDAGTRVTTTVRTIRNAMNSEEPRHAVMNGLATGETDIDPDGLTESILVAAGELASRAFDKFQEDPYDLGAGESRTITLGGDPGELVGSEQGYAVFYPDDGDTPQVVDPSGVVVGQTTQGLQDLAAEPMPGSDWSPSASAGVLDPGDELGGYP